MKVLSIAFFIGFFIIFATCPALGEGSRELTAPSLTNNPSLDVIVTNPRPLFSFFNASGGEGNRTYDIQIDTRPSFDSKDLIEYKGVKESNQYITNKRDVSHKLLEEKHSLDKKTRYYWRVRALDSKGNTSSWASSRFFFEPEADDAFMGLVRVPAVRVEVSSGVNAKNIIDLDDPGQVTFWQSTPPGDEHQWVKFDLGKEKKVSRIWMLSNPSGSKDGWLTEFEWQASPDGENWTVIPDASLSENDTFRNILDFPSVKARYLRLYIKKWQGYAAQINAITIYSPGEPEVPEVPEGDYVLLIGNQQNGFTFSELADFVENAGLDLKTVTVPHYEVSLKMLESLPRRPIAIILSGNNADYPNLPMFEYNGEYEIIRQSDIPILGICCGHQQLAMAYGYTFARSMGWDDISAMDTKYQLTQIKVEKEDAIFDGMKDPFTAVEIHGWAVAALPEDHEVIAASSYIQAIKSTSKMLYGEQFHGEIKADYNDGSVYLINFLEMAKKAAENN